jgi:hypothetical protein
MKTKNFTEGIKIFKSLKKGFWNLRLKLGLTRPLLSKQTVTTQDAMMMVVTMIGRSSFTVSRSDL